MKSTRITLFAFLAVIVIAGSCGLLYLLHHERMQDNPTLLYRYYESELQEYAGRLEAGEVYSEPNRGFAIPRFLIHHGARYVTQNDDCFVISFGFMPTDAVPELWYSPQGFEPLPPGLQRRQGKSYFQWEQLSQNWGSCYWDQ